jgi:hypothetical protein
MAVQKLAGCWLDMKFGKFKAFFAAKMTEIGLLRRCPDVGYLL